MEKDSNVTVALVRASSILREIAEPERGKRALLKLSAILNWSYRHIKAVYYREFGTVVDADEMAELERKARIAKEREASNEIRGVLERLSRLENALLAKDPDFYSDTIEAIRVNHARLRGVAHPDE